MPLRSNPKRARERRERAGLADPDYLAWLRAQPCCLRHLGNCSGRIDPNHHTGKRGLGQKADDKLCHPLCRKHHEELHLYEGFFATFTRDSRRAWQTEMGLKHRALYEAQVNPQSLPTGPEVEDF